MRANLPPSFRLSPCLWVDSVSWDPKDWASGTAWGEDGVGAWGGVAGLTWDIRQLTLLILQGGHVIAGVFPLVLGEGAISSLGSCPPPSPRPPPGIYSRQRSSLSV